MHHEFCASRDMKLWKRAGMAMKESDYMTPYVFRGDMVTTMILQNFAISGDNGPLCYYGDIVTAIVTPEL